MGKSKARPQRFTRRRDLNWLEKLRFSKVVDEVFAPKYHNSGIWYTKVYVVVEFYSVNFEKTCEKDTLVVEWNDGRVQEYRMSMLNNRGCRSYDPRGDRAFRSTGRPRSPDHPSSFD